MILFIQSKAVLHKYLNDKLKILCLLQCFPEVAQNSLRIPSFPCLEKSLSIPGLWPPCIVIMIICYYHGNNLQTMVMISENKMKFSPESRC